MLLMSIFKRKRHILVLTEVAVIFRYQMPDQVVRELKAQIYTFVVFLSAILSTSWKKSSGRVDG